MKICPHCDLPLFLRADPNLSKKQLHLQKLQVLNEFRDASLDFPIKTPGGKKVGVENMLHNRSKLAVFAGKGTKNEFR